MDIVDSVKRALQEMVLPELGVIRAENGEIKARLELTNKRLDDLHTGLMDLSRRADNTNTRIDDVRSSLTAKMEDVRSELATKIENVRSDLTARIEDVRSELTAKIDEINRRLDRLYDVIVRRDEHYAVERRVAQLEHDLAEIKSRLAA